MPVGEPDGTLRINAVVQYSAVELKAMIHGSVGTTSLDDEGTEEQASEWEGMTVYPPLIGNETTPTPETGSYCISYETVGYIIP